MNRNNINTNFIVFIVIAFFYLIGNLLWYKLNTPIIIQGIYNNYFFRVLQEGEFFFEITPLIIWIMKGCLKIFGNKYFDLEIIFMNYFFFLIALYFINKICIEIKDKQTGIIAMILFALTPAVYGASRQYGHHDYHIMCISILNIYALIRTDYFINRKWSVFYGISVGVGLLAKDAFLAYFFVPYMYFVIKSLMEKANRRQKIINIITTILTGSLIAGCHYFNLDVIVKILKDPLVESHYSLFSFEGIRIFTTGLSEYLLSFPIFLLFLISVFLYILKYKNIKYKYIIFLWFITPWIVLMLMRHHKQPDYGLGLIPPIIIIVSLYISNIKNILYKKILSIVLVIVCLLQYISFSYGINIGLSDLKIHLKDYNFYYYDINYGNGTYYPNMLTYNRENGYYCISMVKYLEENFKDKTIFVYKDSGTEYFDNSELATMLKLKKCDALIYFDDIIQSEVIVFNKGQSILENFAIEREKIKLEESLIPYNIKELENNILSIIDILKYNYIVLDEFDLNVNDTSIDENHIIVLGRKDLFEENYKLKYKYRFIRFDKHR